MEQVLIDRIEDECEKIRLKLLETKDTAMYNQLYAARQALMWALNPKVANSPYKMIMRDILGDSGDCPVSIHPVQSSDSGALDGQQE